MGDHRTDRIARQNQRSNDQLQSQDSLRERQVAQQRERPHARDGAGERYGGSDEDRGGCRGVAEPERDQQHGRDDEEQHRKPALSEHHEVC